MTSFPFFSCLLFSFWPVGRTVAHLILPEPQIRFCYTLDAFVGPSVGLCLFYTFSIIYQSEEKIKAHHLYAWAQLEWTCEWGDFIALPAFISHPLVGWPFSGLLCKMWRQWQPFAASSSPHRVWLALQCSPSHVSFLLFSPYQMSDFAQIFSHSAGGGCERFLFFKFRFHLFFLHSFQLSPTHYGLVQILSKTDANTLLFM